MPQAPGTVPITFTSALVCDHYRALGACILAGVLLEAAAHPDANKAKVREFTQVLAELVGPDVYT